MSAAFSTGTFVRVVSARFSDLVGRRAIVVPVPDRWLQLTGESGKVFWRMVDATGKPHGCTYWGRPDQLRVEVSTTSQAEP